MKNENLALEIVTGIICFLTGMAVVLMPPTTVIVHESKDKLYTEYKDVVYRLIEPYKIEKDIINH